MSPAAKHVPTRTCAGCNARDATPRLVRFTLQGDRLVRDGRRPGTGRGAYLHWRSECLAGFAARKPFLRSLGASLTKSERSRFITEG
jgi:hypothetical protein